MTAKQISKIAKTAGITSKEYEIRMATSHVLGHEAYKNGKTQTFALDQKAVQQLAGLPVGTGLPIINAWIAGWTLAQKANTEFQF